MRGELATLAEALDYRARGWPVLPLWPLVERDGALRCACVEGADCERPGKHPWCAGGVTAATVDARRVEAGWRARAQVAGVEPNIGVATGGGLLVIDLDAPALGDETWRRLVEGREPVETVEAITGRGRHLYFDAQGLGAIPSSAGRLGPGVDVRGEGGYVVAPPSRHASGRRYVWEASSDPRDGVQLATAPAWLVELARAPVARGAARRLAAGELVGEGGRNDALARACCSWLARGVTGSELREAVEALNASACDPPLGAREVARIIGGCVRRYRPGLSTRVLEQFVAREAIAYRAERLGGAYAFKNDAAWWAASMSSPVPEDPDAGSRCNRG